MLPTALLGQLMKARFLLDQHASTILTGMGVAGSVSTAVLTTKATVKAVRAVDAQYEENLRTAKEKNPENWMLIDTYPGRLEMLRLVWPLYIPPAITGITTIMAIVSANRIDSKKIAALTVAAGVSDRTLLEYKTKLEEKLTARQYASVKDDIANDRVQAAPVPSNGQVMIVGEGKVLCFDELTGRYFHSSAEEIRKAENKLNHWILNNAGASLEEFHDELGLEGTSYTSMVGWGPENMVEVEFHSVLKDDKPVLAINFNYPPTTAYMKLH
jgi:hypothetical protein